MLDEDTQAILLLASRFGRMAPGDPEPLSPTEYGRFAAWLQGQGQRPRDLLRNFREITRSWHDPKSKITVSRLEVLLGRGMAMSVALETWASAGIWILTRAHAGYPLRLRERLRTQAPAVLLGVGDAKLLNSGGVAIVGSRDIQPDEQTFASSVATAAALEGFNVVSGGARGVDEIAMRAAIETEGTAVGVLANDLLKAALSANWRKFLKSGHLCLVTPFYPEAPFQVGNAMGRNKYVYCLSDFGVVVRAEEGRGGTWAGAQENLKNGWVPLFVRAESSVDGIVALAASGATELHVPAEVRTYGDEWLRNQLEAGASPVAEPENAAPEANLYSRVLGYVGDSFQVRARVSLIELKRAFPEARQKELVECLDRAVDESVLERCGPKRIYKAYAAPASQQGLFDHEE